MSELGFSFTVGELYSNEEIHTQLGVGNSGGIRVSLGEDKLPQRLVVMTQSHKRQATSENPYSDRIEGDVLVYTAAGKEGDQALSGVNQRIPQQADHQFPIYCFSRVVSRRESRGNPRQREFVGLLQYLRYFPSKQIDVRGELRGSLEPFASGAVVTTGHFSKAAIREAEEPGKRPIVLVNGYEFATLTKKMLDPQGR